MEQKNNTEHGKRLPDEVIYPGKKTQYMPRQKGGE
jgi:hypothetical protein